MACNLGRTWFLFLEMTLDPKESRGLERTEARGNPSRRGSREAQSGSLRTVCAKAGPTTVLEHLSFTQMFLAEPHVRSRNTKQSLAGLLPAVKWGDEYQLVDPMVQAEWPVTWLTVKFRLPRGPYPPPAASAPCISLTAVLVVTRAASGQTPAPLLS